MTTEKTKAPRIKSIAAPTGTFPVEVTVTSLSGGSGTITFDCMARTQTAWSRERGDLYAKAIARQKAREAKAEASTAKAASGGEDGAETTAAEAEFDPKQLEKMFSERIAGDAEMVLQVAKGWDLEDDFTLANITALEDTYPGAINDLVNNYSAKIHGARTKN